jgi:hypothetical protein
MNPGVFVEPIVQTTSSLSGVLCEGDVQAAGPPTGVLAHLSLHFRSEGFTDATVTVSTSKYTTSAAREELLRLLHDLLLANQLPPLRTALVIHAEPRLREPPGPRPAGDAHLGQVVV